MIFQKPVWFFANIFCEALITQTFSANQVHEFGWFLHLCPGARVTLSWVSDTVYFLSIRRQIPWLGLLVKNSTNAIKQDDMLNMLNLDFVKLIVLFGPSLRNYGMLPYWRLFSHSAMQSTLILAASKLMYTFIWDDICQHLTNVYTNFKHNYYHHY